MRVRLRQVALVARELEPVVETLRTELDLGGEPFHDPGVAVFGLRNAVMAVGDTFLEVVAPIRHGTAAGRYLERRRGDGGYMAIFQVDDLAAARRRVAELGIRVVWQADLPDIAGTHLHPKDVPGALVSIDWASPTGSWRWGGPEWAGRVPEHTSGGVVGLTLQSPNPVRLARRWAEVLDLQADEREDSATVALDGGEARFELTEDDRGEGIRAVKVALPAAVHGDDRHTHISGVVFHLVTAEA